MTIDAQEVLTDMKPDENGVLPDGRRPYENSDAGMSLLLQDFATGCRTELAKGNDISEALKRMTGIAHRSQVLSRNYTHLMEGLLPEIPDQEVVTKYTLKLSGFYQRLGDGERANELLDQLERQHPDPASDWGQKVRYVRAVREFQMGELESAKARLETLWEHGDAYDAETFNRIGFQLAEVYDESHDWEGVLRMGLPALPDRLDERDRTIAPFQNVANAYLQLGDYENAERYYQRIDEFLTDLQKRDPNNSLLREPTPQLIKKGLQHARAGQQQVQYQVAHEEAVDKELQGLVTDVATEMVANIATEEVAVPAVVQPPVSAALAAPRSAESEAVIEEIEENREGSSRIGMGAIGLLLVALVGGGAGAVYFKRGSV